MRRGGGIPSGESGPGLPSDFEQLAMLDTLGYTMGQGYILARPMSADAFHAQLASGHSLRVAEPVA